MYWRIWAALCSRVYKIISRNVSIIFQQRELAEDIVTETNHYAKKLITYIRGV
jgi:hypothetical protein